jgi:nicotinate dehydrogenase subunit A
VTDTSTPDWASARTVPAEEVVVLRVNGEGREVRCRTDAPLLYLLRNDLGLKGSRFGCGLGQCGACMVLLDGHPTPSCDVPAWAAQGHEVRTIEGLSEDEGMVALQGAFLEEQAAQCGYCTSGILVSACALLRADPQPDGPAISAALERNLCRCGSHGRVLRAVARAADVVCGSGPAPHEDGIDRPAGPAGPNRQESSDD